MSRFCLRNIAIEGDRNYLKNRVDLYSQWTGWECATTDSMTILSWAYCYVNLHQALFCGRALMVAYERFGISYHLRPILVVVDLEKPDIGTAIPLQWRPQ